MRDEIARIVEAHWESRMPALLGVLGDAQHEVNALLARQQEHQRNANPSEERLGRSLGRFGSEALDLEALSAVLHQSGDTQDQGRQCHQRLQRLSDELAALQLRLTREPPRPVLCGLHEGPEKLLQRFDAHVAPVCDALRLVRQAQLEVRGRYDPGEHDPLFAQFDWRQLDSDEVALCPPFVVISESPAHPGTQLAALLELLTSGRPLKVVVLHRSWHPERAETGRAAALRGMDDVTLLFLALRNVSFVQTSPASPTPMAVRVAQGLDSPRPALLSVFAHGSDLADVARRAATASASRGFPHLLYDPQQAPDFVSCLDLSDNPEPAAQWVAQSLAFVDEDGEQKELERPFTFADYAWNEPELRGQFAPLQPNQEEHALPLAVYLDLEPSQRRNRLAFVFARDPEQRLVRLVPSQAMLAHTSDCMHLWTTLRQLSGIGNPYVLAAERRLCEQFTAEKDAALHEQQARLEVEYRARQQAQLAEAIRTLVARLTGTTVPASGARETLPAVTPASLGGPPARGPAAAAPEATSESPHGEEPDGP